jgi:AcrR family transcriptional regulator
MSDGDRQRISPPTWDQYDPLSTLHPTARKILKAARRLLEKDGFAALKFDAIARASGQYKGSITYFFGDKATLVAMLADLVSHDIMASARKKLSSLPRGEKRIHEAVKANELVSRNSRDFRVLLEIAAHAVARKDLRERIAALYATYREVNRLMLDEQPQPESREDVDRLAVLSLAILDGLSLQYALDPEAFDPGPYWAYWEEVISERLLDKHRGLGSATRTGA